MPRQKKEMITWKEKALAKAKARTAVRPAAGTSNLISIEGGVFSYGGAPMPEELSVIVLDEAVENSRFKTKYVKGEFQTPICYALSEPMSVATRDLIKGMAPHEKCTEPQAKDCASCNWNQFGSAPDGGRGKGCGNRRRLLLMAADHLDDIEHAMVALLKVPPTGLVIWDAYADWLSRIQSATPEYVITKLYLKKIRPTDMAALPHYDFIGYLPDDICEKIDTIVENNRHILKQPFPEAVEQMEVPVRKRRVTKKRAVRR